MNETYKVQVQDLVDDLKAVFTHAGLGGEAGEYKLLTQSFLYKFLNDKFLYQAKVLDESNTYENLLAMSEEDYDWLLEDIGTSTAWLKPDQLIESLHRKQNESDFYETFENTLNQIAIDNNDIFSVHTDGDTAIRLFDERLITDTISDSSKRNEVAKAIINLLARVKFDEAIFSQGFDFLPMDIMFFHDTLEFFVERNPLRVFLIALVLNPTCNSTFQIFQIISC